MSILGMASAGLAAGAVAVSSAWYARRRDSLGRPRDFPVWSVSLLTVLALGAAVPGVRRHQQETRLARVASVLVGAKVTVHCQSIGGALVDVSGDLGYVRYSADGVPEHSSRIKRDQCHDLRHYVGHRHHPSQDDVVAVHVLTHEAMHMRGETSESTAECEAVQRDRQTATLLGASPSQAEELARLYWRTVYPSMPDGYRTADCAPGGPLDEHLATAPWAVPAAG
jgi:hypothetical protein